MASRLQMAKTTPASAPRRARTALSVRIWRVSLQPLAPSAARMASSFPRARIRASCRFATFAQAMSKTQTTAPGAVGNEHNFRAGREIIRIRKIAPELRSDVEDFEEVRTYPRTADPFRRGHTFFAG